MKHCIFLVIIVLYSTAAFAQQETVELVFSPMYLQEKLINVVTAHKLEEEEIIFTRFKCYLTNFELWNEEERVWKEAASYHLIDIEDPQGSNVQLELPSNLEYTTLKYQLGVDSATNVAGVMGGDLDPTKGMYWAWNSGYINFKLEGKYAACPTRKNKFQFHLGGYMPPFNSVQQIEHSVVPKSRQTINIEVDQLLTELDLSTEHTVMSPSQKSVLLSALVASIFHIQTDD